MCGMGACVCVLNFMHSIHSFKGQIKPNRHYTQNEIFGVILPVFNSKSESIFKNPGCLFVSVSSLLLNYGTCQCRNYRVCAV